MCNANGSRKLYAEDVSRVVKNISMTERTGNGKRQMAKFLSCRLEKCYPRSQIWKFAGEMSTRFKMEAWRRDQMYKNN